MTLVIGGPSVTYSLKESKIRQSTADLFVKGDGEELFTFLGYSEIWQEILKYLKEWKKEIPELPETNFDLNAESSFEEIKDLNPAWFRSIFENDEIFNDIVLTIFPQNKTLKLLFEYYKSKSSEKTIYKTLSELIKKRIN